MARLSRLYVPGCSHHLIQRGNNRQDCFYDPFDRLIYLRYLREAAEKASVALHAFVLMTNHVHMLATPSDAVGCGRMMQSLGRRYVGYFNKRHKRSGTLWEGRYRSTLIDSDAYFFAVCRYIELNPVRAGIVAYPSEFPWSSYYYNALGRHIELLTPHPLYSALGEDQEQRCAAYRLLFEITLSNDLLAEIREATNKAWALGTPQFKQSIREQASRRLVPLEPGRPRKNSDLSFGVQDQLFKKESDPDKKRSLTPI